MKNLSNINKVRKEKLKFKYYPDYTMLAYPDNTTFYN